MSEYSEEAVEKAYVVLRKCRDIGPVKEKRKVKG